MFVVKKWNYFSFTILISHAIILAMEKKKLDLGPTDSLLLKFAVLFGAFTIVTLLISGITTYTSQMKSYKDQCVEKISSIGDYLEQIIQSSGEDFVKYQDFYMEHFAEADIPYDFDECNTARQNYITLLSTTTPPGYRGNGFDSYSDEAKMAYFIYMHEYWLLLFEQARKAFNLPYTYYLVPKEEIFNMVYMIDGERLHKGPDGKEADEGEYLFLGFEYHDPYEKTRVQWDTWFTGEKQNGFQIWKNEWGHTYGYYTPLIINGKKLGLIGTEIEVADVNNSILSAAFRISGEISVIMIICIIVLLLFVNDRYVEQIRSLEADIREYEEHKKGDIVNHILSNVKGKNEISSLAYQFANLILEMEEHMNSLSVTAKELEDTKQRADEMNLLAIKDSLTGIRNKTAYDNEIKRLELQFRQGYKDFGIVMIDLNYLKKINDTYGHERGNAAIKKLCYIVCHVFAHSPVFRIGGDEFVVILERNDYNDVKLLVETFNSQIAITETNGSLEPWERITAAIGYALYDEETDTSIDDVFCRADKNMYAHKKQMKAQREK